MSNDTGLILKHISARVDYIKIYFALTFFDKFSKEQFDPDADINEQKIEYLVSIQKKKINEYLEESEYSNSLINRIENDTIVFYLSGLKYSNTDLFENGYNNLNLMLDTIRKNVEISKSKNKVCKDNPNSPIVTYDYKKLSVLYLKAQNDFISSQEGIYISSPPHFKTTEALTHRLKTKKLAFTVLEYYNQWMIYIIHSLLS